MMDVLQWVIAVFGTIALIGAFVKMKEGFGPFNLRVLGIIMIATLSSLLALHDTASMTAAMGILGAIAGYIFGIREK